MTNRYEDVAHATPNDIVHETHTGWDSWSGTAEQLIAAGIIQRQLLPGEPGNNKISATYWQGKAVTRGQNPNRDETYLNIVRYGNRYTVKRGITTEERQRRDTVQSENYAREREQREKEQKCQRDIASIDRFYGSCEKYRTTIMASLIMNFDDSRYGYTFHKMDKEEMSYHIEALRALIAEAEITFDKNARDEAIQQIYLRHELTPVPLTIKQRPQLRLVKN